MPTGDVKVKDVREAFASFHKWSEESLKAIQSFDDDHMARIEDGDPVYDALQSIFRTLPPMPLPMLGKEWCPIDPFKRGSGEGT